MTHRTTTLLRKVPEITALFWVTKLLTTAMGEAVSDFLVNAISPYIAVAIGFGVFALGMMLQFRAKRYVPGVYWFTVAMVAVFGTMAADVLHKQIGVSFEISTVFFAVCLSIIFVVWHKVEHSLSIHTITTWRREVFYWLTVVTTFALGTAAGDLIADGLHLGYLVAGAVFAVLMIIPLIGYRVKFSETIVFWFAYIVTRPLGASFADWFGKSRPSGIGLGDGPVSIALAVLIVVCVLYMMINRAEQQRELNS